MPAKNNQQQKQRRVTKAIKNAVKQVAQRATSNVTRPRQRRVRGRGGYLEDIGNFFTGRSEGGTSLTNKIFSGAGGAIAGALGIPTSVGAGAGSWLSRALGLGAYSVSKNSLMAGGGGAADGMAVETAPAVNRPPAFGTEAKGSDIIISHSEFVNDVQSSVAFQTTQYLNNPGNPALMPWFAQLSQYYEEFEFLGLIYCYRPTSATAVGTTNAAMGVVIIATEYDAYDAGYTTKRQMEAAEFSSSAVPYQAFMHPIECDPQKMVLRANYVAPGVSSISQLPGDVRFYIPSVTTVATVGQQTAGQTIGELWVTYHIRCSKPTLEVTNNLLQSQRTSYSLATSNSANTLLRNVYTGSTPMSVVVDGTGAYAGLVVSCNGVSGTFMINVNYTAVGAPLASWNAPLGPTPTVAAGSPTFPLLGTGVAGTINSIPLAQGGAGDNTFLSSGSNATACANYAVNFTTAADAINLPLLLSLTYTTIIDVWITPLQTGFSGHRKLKYQSEQFQQQVSKAVEEISHIDRSSKDEVVDDSFDAVRVSLAPTSSQAGVDARSPGSKVVPMSTTRR
jgi:hypothetical protein